MRNCPETLKPCTKNCLPLVCMHESPPTISASEQTSASKREPGYYHIEYKGYECIALYDPAVVDNKTFEPTEWALPSRCVPDDKHVKVIDSRRIERPSPQQQQDTKPTRFDIVKAMADQLGVGNSGPSTIDFQRMHIESLEEERAQLRAEVERLTQENQWHNKRWKELMDSPTPNVFTQAEEIKRLKDGNEKLTELLKASVDLQTTLTDEIVELKNTIKHMEYGGENI